MRNFFDPPTITYCEEAINWIIRRPWYALSNISFLMAAVAIYVTDRSKLALLFASTSLIVGLMSFLYDTTYMYVFQVLDLSAMLFFINVLLWLNMSRLFVGKHILIYLFPAAILSLASIVYFGGVTGNVVFGLYVLLVIISQAVLFTRKSHTNQKYWIVTFIIFLCGFGIWLLDATKLGCMEIGLLNGRAIFHYTSALVIYRMFIFYREQNDFSS